jgi:hypothetical protein
MLPNIAVLFGLAITASAMQSVQELSNQKKKNLPRIVKHYSRDRKRDEETRELCDSSKKEIAKLHVFTHLRERAMRKRRCLVTHAKRFSTMMKCTLDLSRA